MVSVEVSGLFYKGLLTKLLPAILSIFVLLTISVYSFVDFDNIWDDPVTPYIALAFTFNGFIFLFEGMGVASARKGTMLVAGVIILIIAFGNFFFAGALLLEVIDFDTERGDLNKIASIFLGFAIIAHLIFARFEILKSKSTKQALEELFG